GRARAHRAAGGTHQVPRALRDRRRGAVRPGREARSRGDRREEGGRTVSLRPLPQLAQDPRRPHRRLRGRGLHAPQGLALGVRRAGPGRISGRQARVRGPRGSGFTAAQLEDVSAALEQGIRPKPAFAGPAPQDPGHTWVEPTLVAEVRYKEWTVEGLLRQPVFVRFRDDKPVTEVAILGAGGGERDLELPTESTTPRAPL